MNRMTFVLFLDDGGCMLVPTGDGRLALPSAKAVRRGRDRRVLRIPLVTAGFRTRRFHPSAGTEATSTRGPRDTGRTTVSPSRLS